MISYKVKTIMCDGTQAPGSGDWIDAPVVEQGTDVPDVGVLFLSPILRDGGANQGQATLKLGDQGQDPIPLFLLGQNFHLTPADNTGVFFNCPALAAGTKVTLLLGFKVTTPL